jgi:hypothetical protein
MKSLKLKKVTLRDFSAEELRHSAALTGEHSGCFPVTICCPFTTPVGDAYLHNRPAAEAGPQQVRD